jgi:RimJ/RimL family protein N-acetyltransferase
MPLLPDRIDAGVVELRRWHVDHVDELLAAMLSSYPELHPWMDFAAAPPTPDSVLALLKEVQIAFEADEAWVFVLVDAGDSAIVGGIGLQRQRERRALEIGYWVRSDRTNRGYATAAAAAVTEAAFAFVDDIDSVEIHINRANHSSAAIPPKLGYRLANEGEPAELILPDDSRESLVWVKQRASADGDWGGR